VIVHEIRNTRHERKKNKEKVLEEKVGKKSANWFEMIPRR
jgi:hypothetical protein